MKKLSGIAIINDTIGKKIAYTYSEINEEGLVIKSNVKESFIALEEETLKLIEQLEEKVKIKL